MRRHAATSMIAAVLALTTAATRAAVSTTKHNLSVGGPGTIKATSESQICVFCHTPHSAAPSSPLWNRRSPGSTYTPYTSSTAVATPGQPTGASILCLSCHDGTIALGEILSPAGTIGMAGGVTTMPVGPGRLGTDLSDDHPISFNYTATLASQRGELVNPSTLTGAVKLDGTGQMQCTACHNAHDDSNGKFLVMANTGSALCQTCHVKNYWTQSAHSTSSATWNGVAPDPWPTSSLTTVASNACLNCHKPHTAGGRQRLLNSAVEESNCSSCHNANVAQKNIMNEFNKFSLHPIASTTGVHDPKEPAVVSVRHVECYDCHNPHAAKNQSATAPNAPGALAGVKGVNQSGAEVNPLTFEYEVCYRCHADSTSAPAPLITRQVTQKNKRLAFDSINASFHPVAAVGKYPTIPGLIAPWSATSRLYCTDCHSNDTGPNAGGTGPKGPHGSTYSPILERQYSFTDNVVESAARYALCYKCHSRTTLLGTGGFSHNNHLTQGNSITPCSTCHDPHGVAGKTRLINFNTNIVQPNGGVISWTSTGVRSGNCTLLCHGNSHNNRAY